MIDITVINCDDEEIQYSWISKRAFVEDIDSDNEDIPMLDDVLKAVDTDDDEIHTWWRDTAGTIVDDLYEECKRELAIDKI